ncbi:hypothetical protein Tco_1350898, partial [Tanacetum coccineum]
MLYDGNVITKETNVISIDDSKETLMLEEESRSKMLLKQSDLIVLEKKVNIKPVNYVVLNQLSEEFGKRFVPQQELSTEQAFRFPMSDTSTDSSDASPVKVDVPSELPKVSLVNASLKKLKFHLAQFDYVVKKRITPMLSQKDNYATNQSTPNFDQYFELNEMKAQSQEKDTIIRKLKERIKSLNGNVNDENVKKDIEEIETTNIELDHRKEIVNKVAQIPIATTIALGMFKLDLDPLAPSLLKNREAHIDYLKYTQEQADTLRGIIEQAKAKQPLDNALDFAYSSKTPDSNTHVLPSTGLKSSISASRSQPTGNKKNDKISQTSSSNMKNKVEAQHGRVNLSSNKKNCVKNIYDANVKQTML